MFPVLSLKQSITSVQCKLREKSSNNDKKLSIRLNKSLIYIVYNFYNERIYKVTELWARAEQNTSDWPLWSKAQQTCLWLVPMLNASEIMLKTNISINKFINHNLRTTKVDQSAVQDSRNNIQHKTTHSIEPLMTES